MEALVPLAALINSSVELLVQPDAHDVVCEMPVRRYGSRVTEHAGNGVTVSSDVGFTSRDITERGNVRERLWGVRFWGFNEQRAAGAHVTPMFIVLLGGACFPEFDRGALGKRVISFRNGAIPPLRKPRRPPACDLFRGHSRTLEL